MRNAQPVYKSPYAEALSSKGIAGVLKKQIRAGTRQRLRQLTATSMHPALAKTRHSSLETIKAATAKAEESSHLTKEMKICERYISGAKQTRRVPCSRE
jgi:hypothetical protein